MKVSDIIKRENNNIDLIRIIAAGLVVWCHSFALTGINEDYLSKLMPYTYSGRLGVCIFFFFSGLLVSNSIISRKDVVSFVSARFFRIYPAYIVAIVLSVILIGPIFTKLSLIDYFSSDITWKYLIWNGLYDIRYFLPGVWDELLQDGSVNGSLWSLPFEVGCYISVLFCFVLCVKFKLKPIVPLALFLFISLIPHDLFLYIVGIGYSVVDPVILFCFVIGTVFAVYKDKVSIDKVLVCSLLLMCVLTWKYENVIRYVYPIAISILLLYVSSIRPLMNLKPKHDVSYGLYIWHWPIIQIIVLITGLHNAYVVFVLAFVVCYFTSYLSARFIEEPSIELGRNVTPRLKKLLSTVGNDSIVVLCLFFVATVVSKFLL